MHLNAALPDVILATVYQPVQPGIRRKGPDSVPNLLLLFSCFWASVLLSLHLMKIHLSLVFFLPK